MKRSELKKEIKESINGCTSFEEIIQQFSIYITDNFKRRKKPIDSVALLKSKKK